MPSAEPAYRPLAEAPRRTPPMAGAVGPTACAVAGESAGTKALGASPTSRRWGAEARYWATAEAAAGSRVVKWRRGGAPERHSQGCRRECRHQAQAGS